MDSQYSNCRVCGSSFSSDDLLTHELNCLQASQEQVNTSAPDNCNDQTDSSKTASSKNKPSYENSDSADQENKTDFSTDASPTSDTAPHFSQEGQNENIAEKPPYPPVVVNNPGSHQRKTENTSDTAPSSSFSNEVKIKNIAEMSPDPPLVNNPGSHQRKTEDTSDTAPSSSSSKEVKNENIAEMSPYPPLVNNPGSHQQKTEDTSGAAPSPRFSQDDKNENIAEMSPYPPVVVNNPGSQQPKTEDTSDTTSSPRFSQEGQNENSAELSPNPHVAMSNPGPQHQQTGKMSTDESTDSEDARSSSSMRYDLAAEQRYSVPEYDPAVEAAFRSHLSTLIPCSHCSRTFSPDRIQRHISCCIERPKTRKCVTPTDGEIKR